MKNKRGFVIILLILVSCITLPFASAAPILYEHLSDHDNIGLSVPTGTTWSGQTFTVDSVTHTITSIKLKLQKVGAGDPGNIEVIVRGTSGGFPTGAVLESDIVATGGWSGAVEWYTFTFTPFTVLANTEYVVLANTPTSAGGNYISWARDTDNTYADGDRVAGSDGAGWTSFSEDLLFEVYGNTVPTAVSLTISDMDTTDNIYSMKKYYTFVAVTTTTANPNDVTDIYVTCKQSAVSRFVVHGTTLTGVASWHINSGDTVMDIDAASCTWVVAGVTGTATVKIRTEWDFTSEDNLELYLEAVNADGTSTEMLMQTDYFDVISTLIGEITTLTPQLSLLQPFTITGLVTYPTAVGGTTSSTYYPPDAQFTSIQVKDAAANLWGTDTNIFNGAYSISGLAAATPTVTLYYAYANMEGDYTDGLLAGGDFVTITTKPEFSVSDLIDQAGALIGLGFSVKDTIINMLTGIGVYFAATASTVLTIFTQLMLLINAVLAAVLFWFTKMITTITSIISTINDLRTGAGSFTGIIVNMWTTFSVDAWADFVPVLAVVMWMQSVDKRIRDTGQGFLSILVGDAQMAFYFIDLIFSWSFTVFNFVWNGVVSFVTTIL